MGEGRRKEGEEGQGKREIKPLFHTFIQCSGCLGGRKIQSRCPNGSESKILSSLGLKCV